MDPVIMTEEPDHSPAPHVQIQNYHSINAPVDLQPPDTQSTMGNRFTATNSCASLSSLFNNLDQISCPCCGRSGGYTTKYKSGASTYVNCCCLTLFLCPLFWMPFCFRKCKDKQLFCAECGELKAIIPAKSCC